MIHGIGVDIVDVNRFRGIIERHGNKFAKRVLADSEYSIYSESRRYQKRLQMGQAEDKAGTRLSIWHATVCCVRWSQRASIHGTSQEHVW